MYPEPQIEILPYKKRQYFFRVLVVVFLIALPSLIFYTTGYRLNFENEKTTIMTTGGVYVTTDNLEVDVYLNEEQVEKPRFFRSAYYIQHINIGQHRIVVQRPDLQTWVKELPIDSHIVIEVSAFNMPNIPHVRPITKYVTATGTAVYLGVASTTELFRGVTTTVPVFKISDKDAISLVLNEEYIYVKSLFSSSSDVVTESVFDKVLDKFRFSTTTPIENGSTSIKKIIESDDILLVKQNGDIYAVWQESIENIPYYFCIADTHSSSSIAFRYGQHVSDEMMRLSLSATSPLLVEEGRLCRPEVKINRLRQDVYFYDFFPGSSDLILLHLEDGLYVTEIDDRSWQNTQQIYPGVDFRVVVENNTIFILDDGKYYELITEIEPV